MFDKKCYHYNFQQGLILPTDYSLTPGININSLANVPGW